MAVRISWVVWRSNKSSLHGGQNPGILLVNSKVAGIYGLRVPYGGNDDGITGDLYKSIYGA